jgi:hypothetical protein
MGCATEKVWVTFIFRNGVHIAEFFAGPKARCFPPLIRRVAAKVDHYLNQNPDWGA